MQWVVHCVKKDVRGGSYRGRVTKNKFLGGRTLYRVDSGQMR